MTKNKNMTQTKLQQISDVAWLVHQGERKLGILNKDIQENYTYITGKELVKFNNKSQAKQYFGNIKLFEEKIEEPAQRDEEFYIKGHVLLILLMWTMMSNYRYTQR